MCFLQLTWTGSMTMSSVTVALPGITPSTWEKSWSLPMWSSFHAVSLCSVEEETVAVELSTGSPVRAIQGKLWKNITRYAVSRIFLLQCCAWPFSSYKSAVISRVLRHWAIALVVQVVHCTGTPPSEMTAELYLSLTCKGRSLGRVWVHPEVGIPFSNPYS